LVDFSNLSKMSSEPSSGAGGAPGANEQSTNNSGADASRENEMLGSLGEALAGVNLGATAAHHNNGFSFHTEHDSSSPFNLTAQAASNQGAELGGWGLSNGGEAEESKTVPVEPSSPNPALRIQGSMDLFLSQSPSQMLGNDVFKLSTNNLPGLEIPQEERSADPFRQQPILQGHGGGINTSPGFGEIGQNQETRQGRKPESPLNLTGTGTSSRSGSPYNNNSNADGGRGIQAYHPSGETPNQRTPSYAEEDRSGGYGMAPGPGGMQPQMAMMNNSPAMASPYNGMPGQNFGGFNSPYDGGSMQGTPQKQSMGQQQQVPQQPGQQQQVLYMAVPTPDGRGQVLQPVQMVQLPGKPFTYVLPGQPGVMPAMQPGMQPAMPGLPPQQQMMVLPNMPMQQPPQSNDLVNNLIGGNDRINNQNRGSSYPPNALENNQYAEAPGSGVRGEDYNSSIPAGQQDPLTALYNTPQRPPLDALLGQVRRLSRDQVGCRLVQQALDEEGAKAATAILNEGLPFWGEAMVDPFGNYLFQKILEKITPEERIMLVKSVGARLVNASLNLHGTRSVQKIVELCAIDDETGVPKEKKDGESSAEILTRSLAPAAARLCIDSHGNHVIQRILLKLSHKHAKFVFDAVAESVGDVARHRHGCCVIQRCLDSPPCPARSHLVRRIVEKSLELMQDAYGNYVVQYVLDVCSDDDVHAVCESVVGKVNLLAIQKFSSNVMEKCLERCTDQTKEHYMEELSDTNRVRELMMDPFGNYVVQRALSVATHVQAVRLVEAMRPHLTATQAISPNGHRNGGVRNTAGGRRIMAKICRRFPNFNLNGVGTTEELYSQSKGNHRHQHQHHSSPVPQQAYGHLPPAGQPHMQHHQMHHQQRYNVDPHAAMNAHHPFEQRQPYFEFGDTGYFQHTPHMGNNMNMGNGAYPSGF
jgi:hypothetical protein